MSDIVVDSSVMVKWLLPEPDSPLAERLMREVALQGGRLIVLDLAMIEVTNALWKRTHMRLGTPDQARQRFQNLTTLSVELRPAGPLLGPALDIALKYDRAIYDALFVALAQDQGLPAVTADEPLHQAVKTDFPRIVLLRDW